MKQGATVAAVGLSFLGGAPGHAEAPEAIRTARFVAIAAGSFTMGSANHEPQEAPPHRVTISRPFELGECEVTQEQWAAIMGSDPSSFSGCPKCPVETVA